MIPIKGNFFDGSTSSRKSATFTVNDAGKFFINSLEEQSDPNLYSGDISQLDVSPRLGNTPRYLYIKNGANFETNDNDGIDIFFKQYCPRPASSFLHILESRLGIVLVFTVLVLAFMWGGINYGIPSMANIIAKRIPAKTNQYLGKEALEILDEVAFAPSELSILRQQELTSLFQVYANDYPEYQITFKFRKSRGEQKEGERGIGANAFTLPNGTIVFTDEMVNLASNDHELIAILGHEIGHVVHRHILRRMIQNSSISILILFITGDVSSASSLVLALPSFLFNLSYSRDFEIEADDFAYDFLIKNKLDPNSFAQIMQRLKYYNSKKLNCIDSKTEMCQKNKTLDGNENKGGLIKQITPYLSTHPETEDRIRKFMNKKKDRQNINAHTLLFTDKLHYG